MWALSTSSRQGAFFSWTAAVAEELVIPSKQAVKNTIIFMNQGDQFVVIGGLAIHKLDQRLAIC